MGTERDKLKQELMCIVIKNPDGIKCMDAIVNFIIEDRKRILEPLKGINKVDLTTAEKQILKNAGLE